MLLDDDDDDDELEEEEEEAEEDDEEDDDDEDEEDALLELLKKRWRGWGLASVVRGVLWFLLFRFVVYGIRQGEVSVPDICSVYPHDDASSTYCFWKLLYLF